MLREASRASKPSGVGGPGGGVAHHHLEQLNAFGTGDQRAEGGAVGQFDVGSGGAVDVAAHQVAAQHVHHLGGVVAVAVDDHARVPAGPHRQVLLAVAAEGEPLLPHRLLPVGVHLGTDLLDLQILVVEVAENRLHTGKIMGRRHRSAHSGGTWGTYDEGSYS